MNYFILFMSKNNYDLLINWLDISHDIMTPNIINLDLGSVKDQIKIGKEICRENQIEFIESEGTQFQHNIKQVFNYIKDKGIDHILYLHQDCFPIEKDTFIKISDLIKKNNLSNYGFIGFNIYHDIEMKLINETSLELMTTARTILQKGNGYYMKSPKGSRVNYNKFYVNKPFVVENVMWTALLLTRYSFEKYIKVDMNFNFFLAPDDMAFQYLKQNIENICVPYIHFKHDQSIKTKFNMPKDSPLGNKEEVFKRYGRTDHHLVWKKKWGFEWNIRKVNNVFNNRFIKFFWTRFLLSFYTGLETISRNQFILSRNQSKLMKEIYLHDPIKGPIRYVNLKK